MLTDKEKYNKRKAANKMFGAYVPNELAHPFDEKLRKDGLKFSEWLNKNIINYLRKK